MEIKINYSDPEFEIIGYSFEDIIHTSTIETALVTDEAIETGEIEIDPDEGEETGNIDMGGNIII